MDLAELCWIATAAYGLHILEELILDWRNWARSVMHLPVDWNIFYAANALVILMGIVAAELAPTQPTLALAFPALMLINAACFHLGGFLLKRGRFSPACSPPSCSFSRSASSASASPCAATPFRPSISSNHSCWEQRS